MNKAIFSGRLTRDPEVRYAKESGKPIAKFTIAVQRWSGEDADFINCVAFDKKAEFVENYLFKGTKIITEGHIVTGNYENKEGFTVYTTDLNIDSLEFAESKKTEEEPEPETTSPKKSYKRR